MEEKKIVTLETLKPVARRWRYPHGAGILPLCPRRPPSQLPGWQFPHWPARPAAGALELIISDEIQVVIAAPAGLVTHDELITVVERNVETFVRENSRPPPPCRCRKPPA